MQFVHFTDKRLKTTKQIEKSSLQSMRTPDLLLIKELIAGIYYRILTSLSRVTPNLERISSMIKPESSKISFPVAPP